ncbi:hypothetical protein ACFPK5_00755 [Streptomyces beijiangensis]|uniref:hypothetical protein n=1 Tax=Streptomyces beijiangensis TaxID=163361 RepID=UPI0031E48716
MSDAHGAAGPPEFPVGPEGHDEGQRAEDRVRAVVQWYSAQLMIERRAAVPDDARVQELTDGRQAALEDQHRLEEAGAEETERISALYAVRFRELNGA